MVALLEQVGLDSGGVDPAVRRSSGVGGANPRRLLVEEAEHLGEVDVDVAIEVDVVDAIEQGIVVEDVGVHQSPDCVVDAVVRAPSSDHRGIDRVGIESLLAELRRDQTGLEQLATGQPGDDERRAEFDRPIRAQRVDRLEAAVADVAVSFE